MHHSSPPSSLPLSKHQGNVYRTVEALPVPVLDHCSVCIEEQLFPQAFSLLASSLTSGTGGDVAARLPPVPYLALVATLTVHPLLTTRTTSIEKQAAAADALAYLKLVNHLVGPKSAGLDRAFVFGDADPTSSRGGKRGARPRQAEKRSNVDEDDESQIATIRSPFAKKDALWAIAEDFWAVAGWAFNCSVVHPARWERWRLWLDLMLDVLEDDLEARLPAATQAYEASGGTAAVRESLKDSMFARYLSPIGEGRNNKRRLMRAVLADGSKQALAEFGEVWKHETKAPKLKEEPGAKRRKLDLENGQFGDYFDDETDGDSPGDSLGPTRSTSVFSTSHRSRAHLANPGDGSDDELHGPNTPRDQSTSPAGGASFGDTHSLHLRKRLLALLSRFCALNPDALLDTEDLFDLYTEFLRPLPLPVFAAFVSPSTPWLGPHSQASLNQMLLRPLLSGSAPTYHGNALTQTEFEAYFASFAASKTGAGENARVSLLVEGLLRLLWREDALAYGAALDRVVGKGIAERKARSEGDGRRKTGTRARDENAVAVLEASAERMRMVLDLVNE